MSISYYGPRDSKEREMKTGVGEWLALMQIYLGNNTEGLTFLTTITTCIHNET